VRGIGHALSIIRRVAHSYRVRPATLDDLDVLVRHRVAMFTDMGAPVDATLLAREFRRWLGVHIPAGTYRAWLVEAENGQTVGGGGITILPWPPGPRYMGTHLAFVYNVYTEAAHRHRGVARQLMLVIQEWCRQAGITSIALNASADGRGLYESLGYVVTPSPMMFFAVTSATESSAQSS
jgi:GNAT superfamily N-acetyltransferase